ncbi:MAG TPA: tRNA (guanosine(46)-N7)-methyltransferase TrmB [Candidatus Polarisedimenticolaceae bacterium]|nr:tRNA (guanosine(46)-N7)-methyltransferase TrmB [Candidatus Polarisedimenticolaceae bacterium]
MAIKVRSESPLRIDPEAALAGLRWPEVFGRDGRVEVEIGIGKGRFLIAAASARPDVLHLGVEWSNEYLRIAEGRAQRAGLQNVRFVRVDAGDLVRRAIPPGSVAAYYVFYPDPWPKKRHQKRRFLQAVNADAIADTLVGGGWLHVATDHDEYWAAIQPLLDRHACFERWSSFGGTGFPLPVEGPLTNFEAKYEAEGRSRHRGTWRRADD